MASRSKTSGLAIDGRTPSPGAVRELAGQKADIFYFQSPKNHRRFVFCNQLVFFLAILLEADLNVISYSPAEHEDATKGSNACLTAVLFSGAKVSYIACYEAGGRSALTVGALSELSTPQDAERPKIVTAEFIRDQHIQLENWLLMCSIMNRAKNYSCAEESEALRRNLRRFGTMTVGTLVHGDAIDESRMLAAIARGLQAGTLISDTATAPLTYSSTLALRGGVP